MTQPARRCPRLRVALPVVAGLAVGLVAHTFVYAKGYSYLVDEPAACANCHVMKEQFDGWVKSSHHAVATCNDRHAGRRRRQVRHQGGQRLEPFAGLHHPETSRSRSAPRR